MLTLHLVRHGQTNFNAERRVQGQHDSVLDEVGIGQAQQLRPLIESLGLSAVYSSSNVRAKQTTEILMQEIPVAVEYRDALREIYMGPWQQRLWREVLESDREHFTYFMSEPDRFFLEGAETFAELQTRGVAAIQEIIARHFATDASRHVLVVSHGAILKTIIAHYANVPISQMWAEPHLENCSHSILLVDSDGRPRLQTVNGENVHGTIWETSSSATA